MTGDGALAQLGERVLCKHEVTGSIPVGSTKLRLAPPPDSLVARLGATGSASFLDPIGRFIRR